MYGHGHCDIDDAAGIMVLWQYVASLCHGPKCSELVQ